MKEIFEIIADILRFLNLNVIIGIPFTIVFFLLIKRLWKHYDDSVAFQIIRYFLISCALIACIIFIIPFFNIYGIENEAYNFFKRAEGWYFYSYLTLMLFHLFIPLFLFFNKIGGNKIWLLLISLGMNIGMIFESFVIFVTSIHRDYVPGNLIPVEFPWRELNAMICGIIFGIVVFVISEVVKKVKRKSVG